MTALLCGFLMLMTAALCFRGLVALIHDASRWSCTPYGRRWWFWIMLMVGVLFSMGVIMYHVIHGAVNLAWAVFG